MRIRNHLQMVAKMIFYYRKEIIHLQWYRYVLFFRGVCLLLSLFLLFLSFYFFFDQLLRPWTTDYPILEAISLKRYVFILLKALFKMAGMSTLPFLFWCLLEKLILFARTGSAKVSSK